MKTLRLFALTIIMLTVAVTASAEVKGWGLGAGVLDGDFAAQLRKDFFLGGDISAITGQAGVYFQGKTNLRIDADYHWIINSGNPSRFYPLLGVNLATDFDHLKLGLNLGGGANFMLTQSTAAFVEAKYVISDWDGFGIMAGIYF